MERNKQNYPALWIPKTDPDELLVDKGVLQYAEQAWPDAVSYARQRKLDFAVAQNCFESAVFKVSKHVSKNAWIAKDGKEIVDKKNYLFVAYRNEINAVIGEEANVEYVDFQLLAMTRDRLDELANRKQIQKALLIDHVASRMSPEQIEKTVLAGEVVSRMSPDMQRMLAWKDLGYSWKKIGQILGTSAHAAEVYFNKRLRKLRDQLWGRKNKASIKERIQRSKMKKADPPK